MEPVFVKVNLDIEHIQGQITGLQHLKERLIYCKDVLRSYSEDWLLSEATDDVLVEIAEVIIGSLFKGQTGSETLK